MDYLKEFCQTPGGYLMKNLVLFLMIICLAIGTYAFNISESYKVDRSILTEEVFLGDYDIKIHGNRYSISEWWQDQPKIQLDYEGEEVVFQAIEKALQSLGFVFGGGDSFHLKTEIINNRFPNRFIVPMILNKCYMFRIGIIKSPGEKQISLRVIEFFIHYFYL